MIASIDRSCRSPSHWYSIEIQQDAAEKVRTFIVRDLPDTKEDRQRAAGAFLQIAERLLAEGPK